MAKMHKPVYEHRKRVLVSTILPHLNANDRVLDVGCGVGTLGKALMDEPGGPEGLVVEGLERYPRGGEPITVHGYEGGRMPFDDNTYDAVIVADVLHHEEDPAELLRECARVSRRLVIVKDHQVTGILAQQRISLIDWAANAPYGVKCLYRYNTPKQWAALPGELGMRTRAVHSSMRLYPFVFDVPFGGKLQYLAILEHEDAGA